LEFNMKDQMLLSIALRVLAWGGLLVLGALIRYIGLRLKERNERRAAIQEALLNRPRLMPRPKVRLPGML